MAKNRSQPLSSITFHCKPCKHTFTAEPRRVEDAPELEHHPFLYFATCKQCGYECEQAAWQKNLLKAHANATGPKTEEGKAATAANLEGHPTPEEAKRTRFNAMTHGLYARTATYFPARPDKYPHCKGCEVDRAFCEAQPACVKKTELFMLHHAAFEQKNPKHLMGIYADLQASIFAVLQMILQTIIADGVKITTPEWYTDKETGQLIIAQYTVEDPTTGEKRMRTLTNIEAHPLFRPLGEILTRTGLSLSDMGMTAKAIEGDEAELGRLNDGAAQREELSDYSRRQVEALEGLASVMQRAQANKARDPVLIEHQAQNGGVA